VKEPESNKERGHDEDDSSVGDDSRCADTQPTARRVPPPRESVSEDGIAGSNLKGRIGRYEILDEIGHGGMGAVYKARDLRLDRTVALKTPFHDAKADQSTIERFMREAQAMAALRHPNLCPVYDVGCVDGVHYLTMAFIDGESVSAWIKPGSQRTDRQIAELVRKLALALETAHQGGVIHRDIKPYNVMIERQGEPVLMDFGLALRETETDAELTRSGAVIGSPYYMAPEQVEGRKELIGPRTDVYGLGVLFYQLLTGRRPFEGTMTSVMARIVNERPVRPAEIRPGIDPDLESICLRAIAKDRDERQESAAQLAAELDDFLASERAAAPEGRDRQSGLRTVLLGCFASLIAIALLASIWPGDSLENKETKIPDEAGRRLSVPGSEDALAVTRVRTPRAPVAKQPDIGRIVESGQRLGAENSASVRLADLDGDGDLDAFVANRDGAANRAWLNRGDGTFVPGARDLGDSDSRHVALGDLDNDGDMDALICNAGGQPDRVWLNDGRGEFVDSGGGLGEEDSRCSTLGDFDADGDLDAIIGSSDSKRVWINRGDGVFLPKPEGFGSGLARALAAADVDGDGSLDLIVANGRGKDSRDRIWLNDGGAQFRESELVLDAVNSVDVTVVDSDFGKRIEWCVLSADPGLLRLWTLGENDRLKNKSAPARGGFTRIRSGDIDGDGNWDLLGLAGNGYGIQTHRSLDEPATWRKRWCPAPRATDIDLGDLDGDGDLDVFVAAGDSQPNRVWLHRSYGEIDASALFVESHMTFPLAGCGAVALEDLDGDGDLDAIFGGQRNQPNTVWFNDGSGKFVDSGQVLESYACYSVRIADFDSDGDPDAFLANRYGPSRLWFNDGQGSFTTGDPIGNQYTDDVAIADFDNDGDIDFWQANLNPHPDRLWFNDGRGNFTEQEQELSGPDERAWAADAVDIDGDGDFDVLTGTSSGQPNSLWLNDGAGFFERSPEEFSGLRGSNGFAAGDLDGDGDLDLFEAVTGGYDRVWINDGESHFSDVGREFTPFQGEHCLLRDFDQDGDLDAFVINALDQPNYLWLNDGRADFRISPVEYGASASYGVAAGDLDGDGDLDLIVANGISQGKEQQLQRNRIWLNQTIK